MKICVLGSGSKGNSTLVESGRTALLIDAGFSGVEIKRRLEQVGKSPEDIKAILVTHEHNDHIQGVGVLSRRAGISVFANAGTHRAAESRVGKLHGRNDFGTGEGFVLDDLSIRPFAISHDCADPVGFVISDGKVSIGYCTDTGKVTALIEHHLRRCDLLILESNHDPKMLRNGPYPLHLQQRVRSSQGHLANEDAGRLVRKLGSGTLKQVVLAHLSEVNNLPELALQSVQAQISCDEGICLDVISASQGQPTPLIRIRA